MAELVSDFFLALLNPESGRPRLSGPQLTIGLAGAALVQLALDERLRLTTDTEVGVKPGRLVATGATGDLAEPWQEVLDRAAGQRPKDAVARVGGAQSWKDRTTAIRDAAVADLTRREIVAPESRRVLGLIERDRWVVIDRAAHDEVLDRIDSTLVHPDSATKLDGALTGVLHGTGVLPKLLASRRPGWLRTQGKAVARGDWATDLEAAAVAAVAKAISEYVGAASVGGVVATS